MTFQVSIFLENEKADKINNIHKNFNALFIITNKVPLSLIIAPNP